jgi:hypothetical protein
MAEDYHYDEATALEKIVREIHHDWKGLRKLASTGYKAWLTQIKNHYVRIIHVDGEAAAELLASHEFYSSLVRKHGRPTSNKEEPKYLSDFLMPPSEKKV